MKYSTARIRICQWCITLLKQNRDASVSVIDIEKYIWALVDEFVKKPELKTDEQIIGEARMAVINSEPFIVWLFRSLLGSSERGIKIREEFERRKDMYSLFYKVDIEEYASDCVQLHKDLVNGLFRRKDALTGHDKKMLMFMRAVLLKIVDWDNQSERLPDIESNRIKSVIIKTDGRKCSLCSAKGRKKEIQMHHIIPLNAYGTNHENNLVLLCLSCHNNLHWRQDGFKVRSILNKS